MSQAQTSGSSIASGERDWLLSVFASTEHAAIGTYRQFVAGGIGLPGPWSQLRSQLFLGSERFGKRLRRNLPRDRDLSEVPRAQRRPLPEYAPVYPERDKAIVAAYASGGFTYEGARRLLRSALRAGQPDHTEAAQCKIQDLTL